MHLLNEVFLIGVSVIFKQIFNGRFTLRENIEMELVISFFLLHRLSG